MIKIEKKAKKSVQEIALNFCFNFEIYYSFLKYENGESSS